MLKEALLSQQAANPTVTKLGMATGGNLGIFTIMLGQARKVVCPLYLSFPGGNPITQFIQLGKENGQVALICHSCSGG